MDKKQKVLHIVGDPVGGIRKHIHDVLLNLHSGFEFFYITSGCGDKNFDKELPDLIKSGVIHQSLKITKKPSFGDVLNVVKVFMFLRKHKIDIVHGHGAKGGLYARLAGKFAGCRVVYTPHGGVVHNMFGRFESIIYKFIEKSLCIFTDALIFESNYTKNAFENKFSCKSTKKYVNYNGLDVDETTISTWITSKKDPKETHIGVFGIIRKEKGQHLALNAVLELINQGENIYVHFFGDGPMKPEIEDRAKSSKASNNVIFHGETEHVYSKIKGVDFVLIPSLFESFGYVAVEAMLLKVPVISSNVGGLPEIISNDSGFIFDPLNMPDMISVIRSAVYCSEEILSEKVEFAYSSVSNKFSLNRMISFLCSVYPSLLSK